ncbi:MAG: M48 family metallopeptidase [Fibrobacterota bacterium]
MSYSTDFFQNQDVAKQKSLLLVVYFILALLLIIAAIYTVMVFALPFAGLELELRYGFFDPRVFLAVSGVVSAIIGGASLFQIFKYRKGGGTLVAQMLGGRLVVPSTNDLQERRLLNVVEEMAIASGVPVPSVFILEENGINAFAAGYGIDDTVVAVTKGCLDTLDRDELQGVIAHEFSHILNGDMKLNLRLTGILYGLYVLAVIGYTLLRLFGSSRSSGRRSSSSSSDKKGGNGGGILLAIFLASLAFMFFGFLGRFIGMLIQRAFSRQREFLADASAVQFTRNPDGVAGALKKIGGFTHCSSIRSEHAREVSHMFFADGFRSKFSGLMSTHPDLVTRIQRIDPAFRGHFPRVTVKSGTSHSGAEEKMFAAAASVQDAGKAEEPVFSLDREAALKSVGTLKPEHVAYAAGLFASMPSEVVEATRDTYSARFVVFVVLISDEQTVAEKQVDRLASLLSSHEFVETKRLLSFRNRILPKHRLAIVELALSSLGQMSPMQYLDFLKVVRALMEADKKIDAFEFVVRQFIKRQYDRVCGKGIPGSRRTASQMRSEVSLLLSTLARQGASGDEALAQKAFHRGIARFASAAGLSPATTSIPPEESGNFLALDKAVDVISRGNVSCRKSVMEACIQCVMYDEKVTLEEFELIRAVGEMMGVPVPPHIVAS